MDDLRKEAAEIKKNDRLALGLDLKPEVKPFREGAWRKDAKIKKHESFKF